MPLETGTYISDLISANPTAADAKSFGDDHIRLLKNVVKNTFPNITNAVIASHTELNYVVGLTGQPAAKDGSNVTTPPPGDSSTKLATTAFVNAVAFSSSLPGQGGNAGKFLYTDGASATWKQVYPSLSAATAGKTLTNDGVTASWVQTIPPMSSGVAGQYLSNDGASTVWAAAPACLPLTGGLMTGDASFANNFGLVAKDAAGTARSLLKLGTDNNVVLFNAGGGKIRVINQAATVELLNIDNSGAVLVAGRMTSTGVTSTQPVLLPSGTQAAPALSFASDSAQDTGLYLISEGVIGIVCNGVLVGRFTTSGFEAINITQKALP